MTNKMSDRPHPLKQWKEEHDLSGADASALEKPPMGGVAQPKTGNNIDDNADTSNLPDADESSESDTDEGSESDEYSQLDYYSEANEDHKKAESAEYARAFVPDWGKYGYRDEDVDEDVLKVLAVTDEQIDDIVAGEPGNPLLRGDINGEVFYDHLVALLINGYR
jgi:hypothetical protein